MDEQRLDRQNRRNSLESKEGRKARKELLQAQNDAYKEEKEFLYGVRIANWSVSTLHYWKLFQISSFRKFFFKRFILETTFFDLREL